jgi:integrase
LYHHTAGLNILEPKGRVFADIERGKDGYFSHNFSKWFGRYSKQVGIKTGKTSFHSFRHSFKDGLVNAGVEEAKIKALLGHADKSITSIYGSKFTPTQLATAIGTLSYPIEFSHLISKL